LAIDIDLGFAKIIVDFTTEGFRFGSRSNSFFREAIFLGSVESGRGHPPTKKLDPCEVLGGEVQNLRGCPQYGTNTESYGKIVSAQVLTKRK
jgi:hypothetical protein